MINRCLPAVVLLLGCLPAAAQDAVYIAGRSGGQTKINGRIIDYTGRELRFEHPTGKRQNFPSADVVKVETRYGRDQNEADATLAAGRFDQALALYRRARDGETRRWVRRMITARIVTCYQSLGRTDRAGEEFLLLVRDDPDTLYFDCIPLAWLPRSPPAALEQAARRWVAREEPAAKLLGASHRLSGRWGLNALRLLRRLGASRDRRLAQLAVTQTWRADAVTADPARLDQWSRSIEQMPLALQAGPYYVVGRARMQQKQWEEAALALMRVPILYPDARALAAQALLDAGIALEQLGRKKQASRVYRELIQSYAETRPATEARGRMKKEE